MTIRKSRGPYGNLFLPVVVAWPKSSAATRCRRPCLVKGKLWGGSSNSSRFPGGVSCVMGKSWGSYMNFFRFFGRENVLEPFRVSFDQCSSRHV